MLVAKIAQFNSWHSSVHGRLLALDENRHLTPTASIGNITAKGVDVDAIRQADMLDDVLATVDRPGRVIVRDRRI